MCRTGGPRCSGDTRAALGLARARLAEIERRIESIRDAGSEPRSRLAGQHKTAVAREQRWSELYDSTPDGQAELERDLAEATDQEEQDQITRRLQAARLLRDAELAQARTNRARMALEQKGSSDHDHTKPDTHGSRSRDTLRSGSRDVSARTRDEARPPRGGTTANQGTMAGLGDPGSDRVRTLLVAGAETKVHQIAPTPQRAEVLRARGNPAPPVHELTREGAPAFRAAIDSIKTGNRFAAAVHVYDAEEYADMRLFVADDGKAGFALKNDDVISVFVSPDSKYRGGAGSLIANAVAQGGRRLDCFDTVLPKIYAAEGFVPVARVPWNDDYAPEGWDYATFDKHNNGRPDVVLMAYDPNRLDATYTPGSGQLVTDYDEGVALVDQYLADQDNAAQNRRPEWAEVSRWVEEQAAKERADDPE